MSKHQLLQTTIPADLLAALEEIRRQIANIDAHNKKGQAYYLAIGKAWWEIKNHPALDDIGIDGLKPHLSHSTQWLNRCAIAFDGHRTGDLAKAERWAKHNYRQRYEDEPYRMAELVEAYRNRLKPVPPRRLPLALTEGPLFVRSRKVTYSDGTALLGECYDLLDEVPDDIIDLILLDPPYGIWGGIPGHSGKIKQPWDKPLDWDRLWPHLWRVLKPNGTIIICAAEPLASLLVASQVDKFLFRWHWYRKPTDIFVPKYGRPMKVLEPVLVFSAVGHEERTYNPEMRPLDQVISRIRPKQTRLSTDVFGDTAALARRMNYHERSPVDLLYMPRGPHDTDEHKRPFMYGQKPVELLRYLIRVHSNRDDVVLDIAAGCMSTAVACMLERRKFIMYEKDRTHFALGTRRLSAVALDGERS